MKVCFLANTAWYLKNFRETTINAFIESGHEVSLLCPERTGNELLNELSCKVFTFNLDNVGTNPVREAQSLLQVYACIKKLKPDLVYTFNPKTNLYGLLSCRLLGISCIPNVSGTGNAGELSGWKALVYRSVLGVAFKSASHVFFQNNSDMNEFQRFGVLRDGRFSRLPGSGVDVDRFCPSVKAGRKPFIFLLACRLIVQKGVIEYLQAAERILNDRGDCQFWLAGVADKTKRAVPREFISDFEKRGIIKFLGNVGQMEKVLREVDCLVLPSWYPEGVPRTLLEGAAAGKPLITTDRPGCRDVVVEGKNGFYVEVKSVNSLVNAMERVLELSGEELEAMGKASRSLAEDVFDERKVIGEYLKFAEIRRPSE
ncbi:MULTISPECIES: glycosyltransferase family 4 protein [unclassified Marinobacter]|uniref:glycosyltransferase family 4 protein n=1 Tax=unclassified Marinobacter TaxID=83889 RepID=UPI0018F1DAA5|nr:MULTISPECIES: glycosyltransferase family 4 protein [unclassified Marinobacter]